MDWLEELAADPTAAVVHPPPSRKGPPRLPGAARTVPPMPVVPATTQRPAPPRHATMEVDMNWLELSDDLKKLKALDAPTAEGKAARPSESPVPIEAALKPRAKGKKPIPREDD